MLPFAATWMLLGGIRKRKTNTVKWHRTASESHSVLATAWRPHGLCGPWTSPGQNTGVGSCSLLQGIFATQGLKPGLPHCRRILYQLSRQGSPAFKDKYCGIVSLICAQNNITSVFKTLEWLTLLKPEPRSSTSLSETLKGISLATSLTSRLSRSHVPLALLICLCRCSMCRAHAPFRVWHVLWAWQTVGAVLFTCFLFKKKQKLDKRGNIWNKK